MHAAAVFCRAGHTAARTGGAPLAAIPGELARHHDVAAGCEQWQQRRDARRALLRQLVHVADDDVNAAAAQAGADVGHRVAAAFAHVLHGGQRERLRAEIGGVDGKHRLGAGRREQLRPCARSSTEVYRHLHHPHCPWSGEDLSRSGGSVLVACGRHVAVVGQD